MLHRFREQFPIAGPATIDPIGKLIAVAAKVLYRNFVEAPRIPRLRSLIYVKYIIAT